MPFIQGSAEFGVHHPTPLKWCNDPRKIAEPGDVLLSVRAPVGDTNVADQRTAIGRGLAIVRGKDGMTTAAYLRLALEHGTEQLLSRSGGGMFTSITGAALRALPLMVPPLEVQWRVVDLIDAVDETIAAVAPSVAEDLYQQAIEAWMAQSGSPLGHALIPSSAVSKVVSSQQYRVLGVLRSGAGFIDRGLVAGRDMAYTRLHGVSPNQLVYRKLTAWEGPISVTSAAEDGGWVSSEFPVFDVNAEILSPDLLRHMCRWPGLWHRIGQLLVGSVQRRKRLNPSDLLRLEVPMPDLPVQREMLGVLDSLWSVQESRTKVVDSLRDLRSNLMTALLSAEHEIPGSYDELIEELTA